MKASVGTGAHQIKVSAKSHLSDPFFGDGVPQTQLIRLKGARRKTFGKWQRVAPTEPSTTINARLEEDDGREYELYSTSGRGGRPPRAGETRLAPVSPNPF